MGELANTPEGRTRIAAAAERLDRTVAELGNQYRGDIPQGEKSASVQYQHEPEVVSEAPIEFIPFDDARPVREFAHESGEAPPPADDDRHVETHESEGSVPEARGLAEPGMDVDLVTVKPHRQLEDNDAAEIELK